MPAETTVQTTTDAPPDIQYLPSGEAWGRYRQFLVELILKHGCKSVCEIGGGANPWLPIEFVQEHGIDYLIVDISEEELAKADNRYRKLVLDITKPVQGELPACDFVFSRMLAEHVSDPLNFHRNIFNILKPNGEAHEVRRMNRGRELAIRLAVGENPSSVLRRVLGQNARLAGAGATLGGLAAWEGGRFLQGMVSGVNATAPWTYLAVAVVTLGLTQCACLIPARRAARTDVLQALGNH